MAFSELINNLPSNTGMAFVLIQHLDPKHHSLLAERLSKKASAKYDGMPRTAISAGCADYVSTPGR